ncbi:YbfB/YjiJ family MFS transporter [Pseudaminobacter sp. 19-2017]|uniref:YbfB/YjiJ family MFS transporter n=2 Tax=Pseudaminobacter soli (ex Zhang et al. 2022) TaxID=2831468 RepID=A0A942I278_9HYPH|nr:YbfB/YjiJ family MFS transporter [Pseudaminobacter soli]
MIAMAAVMGIGRFVYTLILPGMMEGLGLSPADAGLIASANYLGYLVGAIAAAGGWAHGRERSIMLWGLVANVVLSAAMGVTTSLTVFMIIRFLAGVTSAFVMIFLTSIVFSHLAAASRNDLQAIHFGGVGLGIAASSAMMAALIAFQADWRAGWLGSAALSVIGLIVAAVVVRDGTAAGSGDRREPELPQSRGLLLTTLSYGLFGFGYVITATFLIAIVRAGEAGRLFEALVWLITGVAAIASPFVLSWLARRIGLLGAYAVGCLVEAVGVAASVSLGGYVGPLLGGVLLGGTFVGITLLGLQAGREMAPQSPRRALAIMTAAFGLGQILGPIAAGYIADWAGNYILASTIAALVLLSAALVALRAGAAAKSP